MLEAKIFLNSRCLHVNNLLDNATVALHLFCFLQIDSPSPSDLISDLPDTILLYLPSTADAARTSILSRRWRRVWTHLPEFSLRYQDSPSVSSSAQAHDRVDAALRSSAAATVTRLEITIPDVPPRVPAGRASPWLRFASQRLAGVLRLSLPHNNNAEPEEEVLLLPICERLTAIHISLSRTLQFQLSPAGAFSELTTLRIEHARVDGGELGRVVSTDRCPRLKELALEWITLHGSAPVIDIPTGSLQRLNASFGMGFEGHQLQAFCLYSPCDFCVAVPDLSELYWYSCYYDPTFHHLAEARRHLRRLMTWTNSPATALIHRFDTIHELKLMVRVGNGVKEYKRFLDDINNIAKCQVLVVNFLVMKHAFLPTVRHLLMKCVGIRKLIVQLSGGMEGYPCKLSGCPCGWSEKTDNIASLDSLERIKVRGHDGNHKVELVRLLCKSSAMFPRIVAITVSTQSKHMREKINSILSLQTTKLKSSYSANECEAVNRVCQTMESYIFVVTRC